MKRFEYKTLKIELKLTMKNALNKGFPEINEENIEKKLNEFGLNGWELTSSVDNLTSGGTKEIVLIFKRELK